ncbi:MAG: ZIP family metal transporter, partial [Candidatus Aenigmatarchaeota archaeon]
MDSLLIIGIILLGPIIGSFMGILKRPSERTMFNMMSFAAGIMLSISFLELIPESVKFSSVFLAAIVIALAGVPFCIFI